MHKQYLKQANKFYKKELWKAKSIKDFLYIGAGLTGLSTYAMFQFKSGYLVIPAAAGVVIAGRALLRKRRSRKNLMALLEKQTAEFDHQIIEKKIKEKDYRLPKLEEMTQKLEMEDYTYRVINSVTKKDFSIVNRHYTMGGLAVLLGGSYLSQKSDPYLGWAIAMLGAVTAAASEAKAFLKMRKLKKDVTRIINEKGYEHMETHAFNKNPYDFYKRHILPELQSKQKD